MIVLAYYPSYKLSNHDSCVAIARDGELIYAYEEQKLSRVNTRESKYLPDRSLLSALHATGIDPRDIDTVAVVGPTEIFDPQETLERLEKYFGITTRTAIACPHHAAHTALAVHGSPFDCGVYWTLDAGGEDGLVGAFGSFENGVESTLHTVEELSLGHFYYAMTACCGFSDFEEGKVMGLAAYGEVDPALYRDMAALFHFDGAGHPIFDGEIVYRYPEIRWDKFSHDEFRPFRVIQYLHREICPDLDAITRGYLPETIAATGQRLVQNLATDGMRRMCEHFSVTVTHLALSGGFFLNILVNKELRSQLDCEIFIPPGANDMGLAAGGALWASHASGAAKSGTPGVGCAPVPAFLGPQFGDAEIADLVARFPLSVARLELHDVAERAAMAVANGKVVGWFQGRGEFGPRALGARSVLADPRDPDSKARVNRLLKKRDWFMPYAPAILEEDAAKYLVDSCYAPHMTLAFDVVDGMADLVPAAVHVDGTVRPQIVRETDNPLFHALIRKFRDHTGIGMVLNTSFNRHGVPIVATPRHAVEHLLEGVVDVLFVGGFEVALGAVRHAGDHRFDREPACTPETILQTVMGIQHGYGLLRVGDEAAARRVFQRTGATVTYTGEREFPVLQVDGFDVRPEIDGWGGLETLLAERQTPETTQTT